jgi:hypothetical protein
MFCLLASNFANSVSDMMANYPPIEHWDIAV